MVFGGDGLGGSMRLVGGDNFDLKWVFDGNVFWVSCASLRMLAGNAGEL